MIKTLEYYFAGKNGLDHVIFNKYTIENGVIRNMKGETLNYHKCGKYNRCVVYDDSGVRRSVLVGRAIASTVYGPPPTLSHTADHIDRNSENDTDDNIRWLDESGQNINRTMPENQKSACIVVRDGVEKTSREWVDHLKGTKNHLGREYTMVMIIQYAQKRQHGFAYKEYPDLPGEVWKEIEGSMTSQGRWEISNMNRVKYITKYAVNVLSSDRLGTLNGYPTIRIIGKQWLCHILTFMAFFPEEYANKKPDEMVLHEEDNRLDFRPHKLRIGTQSENMNDAHDNGKYDGKKNMKNVCMSLVNNMFEKEYESLAAAEIYLKSKGYEKASYANIGMVLSNKRKTAYGRTWKRLIT